MKYAYMPGFQEGQSSTPFVCSMSPILRMIVRITGLDIAKHVQSVVEEIAANEEVANSLKQPGPIPGSHQTRQCDIRADKDGKPDKVVLKCFVSWDADENWWVVHVEGGDEQHWEKELFQQPIYQG